MASVKNGKINNTVLSSSTLLDVNNVEGFYLCRGYLWIRRGDVQLIRYLSFSAYHMEVVALDVELKPSRLFKRQRADYRLKAF